MYGLAEHAFRLRSILALRLACKIRAWLMISRRIGKEQRSTLGLGMFKTAQT